MAATLKTFYIETSQTWNCPATGEYEVIAVAGGESGGDSSNPNKPGGATSFGSHLTASGLWGSPKKTNHVGGDGGYTVYAYGGLGAYLITSSGGSCSGPALNGGAGQTSGMGYGAGGGGAAGGRAGKLKIAQLTITSGSSVACTIGAGGAAVTNSSGTLVGEAGTAGVIIIREI